MERYESYERGRLGSPAAILLIGPTASGKSALALALARRFGAEIVSVDSAQIYRGMDIGTAKPTAAERAEIPHHLLDILDPTETYSAGRFRTDALERIEEIRTRGRMPLLVGGTMLYFRALREGLAPLPSSDAGVRAEIDAEARRRGWPALHAELARVDPATAARLAPNDAQRIQRALEVYRLSGRPLSEWLDHSVASAVRPRFVTIALVPSRREELYRRIAARFDAMLERGLIEEVKALRERYRLTERSPSMRCVGYRQVWQFLEGAFDRAALRERAICATRQLAKRQLTWLRAERDACLFDCLAPDLYAQAADFVAQQLKPRG